MSNVEPEGLSWLKEQIADGNRQTQEGLKQIATAIAKRDENLSTSFQNLEREVGKLRQEVALGMKDVARNSRILEPEERPSLETRVAMLEEHTKRDATKWNWILGAIITPAVLGVFSLIANEVWKVMAGHGGGK